MTHLIDDDDLTDARSTVRPTEDRVALVLPRPRPVELLCRWALRPVPIRSARPLEESL
jgi:hypothetical protein